MKSSVINIDPEIMSGTPVFFGTRVPIKTLFDYVQTSETLKSFLDDFPAANREQTNQVLKLALESISIKKQQMNKNRSQDIG